MQRATLPPSVLYLIQRLAADADIGAAAAVASSLMTVPALATVLDAPTIAALHGAPFWEPLLRRVLAQFRFAICERAGTGAGAGARALTLPDGVACNPLPAWTCLLTRSSSWPTSSLCGRDAHAPWRRR